MSPTTRPAPPARRFQGPVLPWLLDHVRAGPVHFTLIDPDKTPGAKAGEAAARAESLGTDVVMLGGSTGITPDRMGQAARAVHERTTRPVVIFPQGPDSLTGEADALLFMSLLNSRDLRMVVRAQAATSLKVRSLHLEPIPMGYLVVAPGMKVGEVGSADCLARNDPKAAAAWALAAEYLGMRLVYLEAGSGAPSPVPIELVRAVRQVLSVPLIVGGGIRSAEHARALLDAGAQVLVTGTILEEGGEGALGPILREVKDARGRRT
ncbi:MAG: geranylgeranylglyceryl/heptaprenylglyceryl phosphate synthase [Euryarchaeota archaeon]|nr:geranylgeranylglyceryl/heptaprenylglyceryl phosphate synthase [Euryarchaeota archaeon]MDE1835907.1 geranylgeranylglyceryl/heptaprenylglyceryl phosphate synthase [Euryarchaeota archaeon]MDE1880218.1 geranylgeranylglyceryl/heptaprenylglyceryl phosphate synthase [Euryarchaeota archaeon]MDE2044415.1 geranylgeranylglyceryl/heptaprenylglyceryl phosphate synthase [Thermoplasmata archaeon]